MLVGGRNLLLSELTGVTVNSGHDSEIRGLSADSREVGPGFLFAALPGTVSDGADFVDDALSRGAAAVLARTGRIRRQLTVPLLEDPEPRRSFALCAARFYAGRPATIAAVTGTSGKTSVTDFTRQIWTRMGYQAGSLGTLGVISPDATEALAHTTPEPVTLHRALRRLAEAGVDRLALEASSHGLDQHRLDGVRLSAAAFTNLSRDHLDYHTDADAYFRAKQLLFDTVLPADGVAVLPLASEHGLALQRLCRQRGQRVLTYGAGDADIELVGRAARTGGQRLSLRIDSHEAELGLPLIGAFQAENVLCALGLVLACGSDAAAACAAAQDLIGVRGRLELVAQTPAGGRIYVDYSHKPDALRKALEALRLHTRRRLVVIFGCGGDRDPGKRPEMGRIAAELADHVIVTDDNPRSEDPAEIRRQALAGCPGGSEIGDRAEAIREGVRQLADGDVLLIAGKGHEQGQRVGDELRPFDDASAARAAVEAVDGGGRD